MTKQYSLYVSPSDNDGTIAFVVFEMTKLAEPGTTGPINGCTTKTSGNLKVQNVDFCMGFFFSCKWINYTYFNV